MVGENFEIHLPQMAKNVLISNDEIYRDFPDLQRKENIFPDPKPFPVIP